MRIPGQHCHRHKSRTSCLDAMDPYCGWNDLKEECGPAPNHETLSSHWQQNVATCPRITAAVDGGWGSWSTWTACPHVKGSAQEDSECRCRSRQCDSPAPAYGGAPCKGPSVAVTNCTVHGGWTEWSPWSACSQSCGMTVKTRVRFCENPAPAHGGRVCVGSDRNEMPCYQNPPCPSHSPPPQDGAWSPWSAWSECSAPCGGGFRSRRRACNSPPPANGGADCQGCTTDWEACNTQACPEVRRLSSWSPWLAVPGEVSSDGSRTERRFRIACRAPLADASLIKTGRLKEQNRTCDAAGVCRSDDAEVEAADLWSEWSEWTPCSVDCGGGQQYRSRTCESHIEDCRGPARMSQRCNVGPCKREWSCWSPWSQCSVSCGSGVRRRTRVCLVSTNRDVAQSGCEGSAHEHEACEGPSCECKYYCPKKRQLQKLLPGTGYKSK